MRKEGLVISEHYHVYNRGVDKRPITLEPYDSDRFVRSMIEFNSTEPVGSLYENSFREEEDEPQSPLVNIVSFCLNPNHFHMILEQVSENGISKYLQKIGGGYTWFFNKKYNRSGSLFQGPFKAKHIDGNDYLLRVSAYVNVNDRIHQLGALDAKLVRSSFNEFINPKFVPPICKKDIVLGQFNSPAEYQEYVEELIPEMIEVKTLEREQELADLWHES